MLVLRYIHVTFITLHCLHLQTVDKQPLLENDNTHRKLILAKGDISHDPEQH